MPASLRIPNPIGLGRAAEVCVIRWIGRMGPGRAGGAMSAPPRRCPPFVPTSWVQGDGSGTSQMNVRQRSTRRPSNRPCVRRARAASEHPSPRRKGHQQRDRAAFPQETNHFAMRFGTTCSSKDVDVVDSHHLILAPLTARAGLRTTPRRARCDGPQSTIGHRTCSASETSASRSATWTSMSKSSSVLSSCAAGSSASAFASPRTSSPPA